MATEAYKLTIGGIHFGAWMQNELYYLFDNDDATSPLTLAKACVDQWFSDVESDWLGCCPESYGIQWLSARRASAGGGPSWVREFPGGTETGTLGTHANDLAVSPIIKLYVASGTNTQGRIFMPTPGIDQLVNNVYASDYTDAIDTLIGSVQSYGSPGAIFNLAVFSPKLQLFVPVVDLNLSRIIGNIRRRRTPR